MTDLDKIFKAEKHLNDNKGIYYQGCDFPNYKISL